MSGQKTIASTYIHTTPEGPPPPIQPDYIITDVCNPDVTGNYFELGTYLFKPTYRRNDGAFWIFAAPENYWRIAAVVGDIDHEYYESLEPDIVGFYDFFNGALGNPYVDEGP